MKYKQKYKIIAGNEAESEIGRISTTKIPGGAEIIITPSEDDWTNENIEVEITWPEGTEDLNKKYSPDGGNNWYDYEGPITVEENTEIIAKLEDEGGQTGEEQTLEITNIDKINPKIKIEPTQADKCNTTMVTITVEDAESGLLETNEYEYYLSTNVDTEEGGEWKNYNPGESFIIGENITGSRYLFVKQVQDKAGNKSEASTKAGPYIFDNTAPKVEEIKVTTPETGTYKAGEKVTIEIKWSEEITVNESPELAIKFGEGEERQATYKQVNGNTMTYEYEITEGDNGELSIISYTGGNITDGVNNGTAEIKELTGNRITADTNAPTVTIGSPSKTSNKRRRNSNI